MPVVTVDPNEYQRFDLTTAPPDGYIMLRPLPYGMKLSRRDKAAKMVMRSKAAQRPGKGRMAPGSPQNDETIMELETANEWAMAYDFAYCIGEHNLTDSEGVVLDFTKPFSLKQLNPKVGSEIERLIFDLNEEEGEETLEDFLKPSIDSSEEPLLNSTTPTNDLVLDT